jgi:hypothetical protein
LAIKRVNLYFLTFLFQNLEFLAENLCLLSIEQALPIEISHENGYRCSGKTVADVPVEQLPISGRTVVHLPGERLPIFRENAVLITRL